MRAPFSKTMAFLDAEETTRVGRVVIAVGLLVVVWGTWLALSKTTVYAVSDEGRLLAAGAASPIQTPVPGVVAATLLVLGADVKAGAVLVELDSSSEKLRRNEEEVRRQGMMQAVE